ncbi:hypothetical protein GQ54DRAFT_47779 [Martensiomyces pterosporus]|nr:hypothetical protein GQ54DRAFT_47779 [Martensiomyces pterosporus]
MLRLAPSVSGLASCLLRRSGTRRSESEYRRSSPWRLGLRPMCWTMNTITGSAVQTLQGHHQKEWKGDAPAKGQKYPGASPGSFPLSADARRLHLTSSSSTLLLLARAGWMNHIKGSAGCILPAYACVDACPLLEEQPRLRCAPAYLSFLPGRECTLPHKSANQHSGPLPPHSFSSATAK